MKLKILISFMVFALIGLLVSGNTIAYFTDTVKEELVKFVSGTVEIKFNGQHLVNTDDPFAVNRSISWSIKNTGTNDVFLCAKVITNAGENVEFIVTDNDWEKGNDEYFYYSKVVEKGDSVNFPLNVNFDDIWDSTTLMIDLEVQAIQASNDARKQYWHWPES